MLTCRLNIATAHTQWSSCFACDSQRGAGREIDRLPTHSECRHALLRVFSIQRGRSRMWSGSATWMFSSFRTGLLVVKRPYSEASRHRCLQDLRWTTCPVTRIGLGGRCGVVISRHGPGQQLRAYSQRPTAMSLTPTEIIEKIPESFDKAQAAGDLLFFPSTVHKHSECDVDVSRRLRLLRLW